MATLITFFILSKRGDYIKKARYYFTDTDQAYNKKYGQYPDYHYIALRKLHGSKKAVEIVQSNIDYISDMLEIQHDEEIRQHQKQLALECPFEEYSKLMPSDSPTYIIYMCDEKTTTLIQLSTCDNKLKAKQEVRRLNREYEESDRYPGKIHYGCMLENDFKSFTKK